MKTLEDFKIYNKFIDCLLKNCSKNDVNIILNNVDLSEIFFNKLEQSFDLLKNTKTNIYNSVNPSVGLKLKRTDIEKFIEFYIKNLSIFIKNINKYLIKYNSNLYCYSIIDDFNASLVFKISVSKYFNIEFLNIRGICIVDYSFFNIKNKFKDKDLFLKELKKLSKLIKEQNNVVFVNYNFDNFYNKYEKNLNKQEIYILWYIYNILKIYRQNWFNISEINLLVNNFIKIFTNEEINKKSKIYLIRNSHEILSFFVLKTSKKNKKEKFAMSLNVKPSFRGLNIGIPFLNKILKQEIEKGFTVNGVSYFDLSFEYLENTDFCIYKVAKSIEKNKIDVYLTTNKLINKNRKNIILNNINTKEQKYKKNINCFVVKLLKPTNLELFNVLNNFVNKKNYLITKCFYKKNYLYIIFENIKNKK